MLEYVALGILIFAAIVLFYGVIVIHDIPYEISVHRNHPHQDAIHVAGWVSLFTLHVLWPFLWIWATLYREDRGWGFNTNHLETSNSEPSSGTSNPPIPENIQALFDDLNTKITLLSQSSPDDSSPDNNTNVSTKEEV